MIGKRFVIFVSMIFLPLSAQSATCDIGYHLTDGKCTKCQSGYYCPDENTELECPRNTQDWVAIFTANGYQVESMSQIYYWSWGPNGDAASRITDCHLGIHIETNTGIFYIEPVFKGIEYDTATAKLWHIARDGHYLSGFRWNMWYQGTKTCSNAPAYAHYTGPGTPDEPKSGGATDYNDCPWECDDGYGRHGDVCVPLCGGGVRYIKTGGGLQFNLYPVAYSAPALAVKYNNTVCYGVLEMGTSKNAINVNVAGKIYHVEN